MARVSRHIPERATHLVHGYAGKTLLAEVWVQGWGTVETETEVFKSMPECDRVMVQWLGKDWSGVGPQHPFGHIETVWRR